MPRNNSGTYTLPAGNPVVVGTLIEASWANDTLNDLASAMTDSLSRNGEGGMLASFRLADGTLGAPGLAFTNETSTGFYRASAGTMWGVVSGSQILQYTTNGVLIPSGKTLTAQGNATVGGTLGVTGAATLSSTLAVTGAITATGGVVGNISGGSVSGTTGAFSSTLSVTGATTLTGALAANGGISTTNITASGDLTLSGTAKRIFGDFSSNSPISDRLIVQTTTANSNTLWTVMPSGSSTTSRFIALNNSTPTNSNAIQVSALATDVRVQSLANGSASAIPLYLMMGGTTVAALSTGNNFLVGTTTDDGANKLQVTGNTALTGTLSVSGNTTLSGGTANGVLYLNGSKVATSGSALTFDGTNVDLATVGAKVNFATTSSATRNYVGGAADGFSLEMVTQRGALQPLSYKQDYAVGHAWSIAGSGAMTLTSTGLGIGTSNPATRLSVDNTRSDTAGTGWFTYTNAAVTSGKRGMRVDTNNGYWFDYYNGSTWSAQMGLDSSGNLGLGVTPSAAGVNYKTFQLYDLTSTNIAASSYGSNFVTNAYLNSGTWTRGGNTYAPAKYNQFNGAHVWSTAAAAGTTITWTDAMTLDASGNLLVADTSAQYSAKLYVNGSIAARNGGVDGTFQNAFVAGYTSNYNERNIIQSSVSSNAGASGFRFQVSNGGGSSGVTTAMDVLRSIINFYSGGSVIAQIQSQGIYMNGGNWIYWDKSGTRSWQMYCNQSNAELVMQSGDGAGTIRLVSSSVAVNGSLSKGSGSFKIDHPLPEKTDTHHLVHSFIEGPQADLIYRGKVNLVNGTATINIDQAAGMTEGTFVVLCRDVQCFTTNESDWTAVRGSVSGNILTIEAQDNTSTASISWMVIGERQDKHMYETDWTDDNGKVIVEPLIKQMVNV